MDNESLWITKMTICRQLLGLKPTDTLPSEILFPITTDKGQRNVSISTNALLDVIESRIRFTLKKQP